MSKAAKKSVIITFKPKDKRPNKNVDKLQIIGESVGSEISFFNADDFARGVPVPSSMSSEQIGYDVNLYEAPIVMAQLTNDEISQLKKDGNILSVEDDGPVYAMGQHEYRTHDLSVEGQPNVQSETIPAGVAQINAPRAWDCSRGKVIKVAVLDTGIDYEHPDLKTNYRFGISFVPDESNAMDYHGHGTHCAGTIAAAINGAGVVGVAPAAYLYGVKVLSRTGAGNWSWLISGIDWCVNKKGINIISMSLGGSGAPQALKAMCDAAFNKGVLLIAAAGNSGPGKNTVGFPAQYDSVVAVSAIDANNVIAPFSSRGPAVELCAPGVQVLSTIPSGGYGTMNGTSMACPHVAGAAALAWGAHRYTNNVTIRRLLAWRANNLGNPNRTPEYGFGRVDAEKVACEMTVPPAIPGIP